VPRECEPAWYLNDMRRGLLVVMLACGSSSAPPPPPAPATIQPTKPARSVREEVLAVTHHVYVLSNTGMMTEFRDVIAKALALDPIVETGAPLIGATAIATTAHAKDVAIDVRGEDETQVARMLRLDTLITSGSLSAFTAGGNPPPLVLGRGLAKRLGVKVGDPLDLVVPPSMRRKDFDRVGAWPEEPLVKPFRIVAIYELALGEFDSRIAFTTLAAGMALADTDSVGVVALRLEDPDRADDIAARLGRALGPEYKAESWNELNKNLLDP